MDRETLEGIAGTPHMVVLFGKPGIGKGTQAEMLKAITLPYKDSADNNIPKYFPLSTGDMLRRYYQANPDTELGLKLRKVFKEGALLDDDSLMGVLKDGIRSSIESQMFNPRYQTMLADGFPRTVNQARMLRTQRLLDTKLVVYLNAPDAVVVSRIVGRGRDKDDNHETAMARIVEYDYKTMPVINYYRMHTDVPVVEVDSTPSPREVHSQVVSAINSHLSYS